MSKNNVHVLTEAEVKAGKDYYSFKVIDDMIVMKPKDFNRSSVKQINEDFTVRYKVEGQYIKVSISKEAVDMWHKKFSNYHLIEVQNAINKLVVMYQTPNEDDVKLVLSDPDYTKIRKVI